MEEEWWRGVWFQEVLEVPLSGPEKYSVNIPGPIDSIYGYLVHKKCPPPQDHHKALGTGLPQGPGGTLLLMIEVLRYIRR